jgi:hypothetical protein
MKSVYSAVRTGPLNRAVCAPSLKDWCYESMTGFAYYGQIPATNVNFFIQVTVFIGNVVMHLGSFFNIFECVGYDS